jgi:hypothetical protein
MPKLRRTIFIEGKEMSALRPLDGGAGNFILSILGCVVAYRRRADGAHFLYGLHDAEQNALKSGDLAGEPLLQRRQKKPGVFTPGFCFKRILITAGREPESPWCQDCTFPGEERPLCPHYRCRQPDNWE